MGVLDNGRAGRIALRGPVGPGPRSRAATAGGDQAALPAGAPVAGHAGGPVAGPRAAELSAHLGGYVRRISLLVPPAAGT